MKITLGELKIAQEALNKVMVATLSAKVAYHLSKMIGKINEELTHLENSRRKIIEQYGEKNEKGDITVKKENTTKFYEDFQVLMKEETDIDINLIKLSEIQDIKLSATEVLALGKLLEDDLSENKK